MTKPRHIQTETTTNGVTTRVRMLRRHMPWARWSNWVITEGRPLRIEAETTSHVFRRDARRIAKESRRWLGHMQRLETLRRTDPPSPPSADRTAEVAPCFGLRAGAARMHMMLCNLPDDHTGVCGTIVGQDIPPGWFVLGPPIDESTGVLAIERLEAELGAEQASDLAIRLRRDKDIMDRALHRIVEGQPASGLEIHLRTLPARRTVADKLEDLDHTMEDLMTDEDDSIEGCDD